MARIKPFDEDDTNNSAFDRYDQDEKTDEDGTNGLGQVQYFVYPNTEESMGELDFSQLDKFHLDIQNKATNGLNGEEEMGIVEPQEKIY